jgi:hypothetical protein
MIGGDACAGSEGAVVIGGAVEGRRLSHPFFGGFADLAEGRVAVAFSLDFGAVPLPAGPTAFA